MSRLILALVLVSLSGVTALAQRTFYIDYAAANDSANGTTTSTPWKRCPGMVGFSGSYSHQAGDRFIFKGGATWPNSVFPITLSSNGTSSARDYYGGGVVGTDGVGHTWYSGASWTRPIFDAGGVAIPGAHNNFVRSSGGGSYVTWDNIEWTGYLLTNTGYTEGAMLCFGCGGSLTNAGFTNNYVHHWSHGTQTSDAIYVLLGNTNSPWMSGSTVDSNVFDNSDGDAVSGSVMYGWSGSITRNVIRSVPNAILPMGSGGEVAYNHIGPIVGSFDASVHENALETLGGTSPTWYIHDNVIHDMNVGEAMMIGNNGETDYVWNNLIYNLTSANPPHFAQNSGQSITRMSFWNNTIVPPAGVQCFIEVFSPTIGRLDIQNNHCITTGALSTALTGVTTLTGVNTSGVNTDTNLLQTPTAATAQGYTASQSPYVYAPTVGGSTIGAGTNLTSSWPGGYSTSDTTYACTVDGTNHVVCPARTTVVRGSTWDAGAYQYAAPVLPVTFTPSSLNFSNQSIGSTSTAQSVTVQNTGESTLTITTVSASGDFAQSSNCVGSHLGPSQSCTINVTFSPTIAGARAGNLTLATSSGNQTVPLSGTGVALLPNASLSTGSLSFGNHNVGTTSSAQVVTLSNTGTATLNIASIGVSGNFSETHTCTSTLTAGANCSISVTFSPTGLGVRSGSLVVTDDSGGVAGSTQTASVSGTGTSAAKSYTFGVASSGKSFSAWGSTTAVNTYPLGSHSTTALFSLAHVDVGANTCNWSSLATLQTCGNLTGRNRIITPGVFGPMQVMRLTDSSLACGGITASPANNWIDADDGLLNLWNKDDTAVIIKKSGQQRCLMHFDPVNMQATPSPMVLGATETVFGSTANNEAYRFNGTVLQKLTLNLGADTFSTSSVYDVAQSGCLGAGFTPTWAGVLMLSKDDTTFSLGLSNTGAQGTGIYATSYSTTTTNCSVWNTQTGDVKVAGSSIGTISTSDRGYIHEVYQTPDPAYALVVMGPYISGGTNVQYYAWEIGTTTALPCGSVGFDCSGHFAPGRSGTIVGKALTKHNHADPTVIQANLPNGGTIGFPDLHPSWNNGNASDTAWIMGKAQQVAPSFDLLGTYATAFTNAIWMNSVDGSGAVSRQFPTYATGNHGNFEVNNAIAVLSQTGRFVLWTSDWMGTLGSTTGATTCVLGTNCKSDDFVGKLQ